MTNVSTIIASLLGVFAVFAVGLLVGVAVAIVNPTFVF